MATEHPIVYYNYNRNTRIVHYYSLVHFILLPASSPPMSFSSSVVPLVHPHPSSHLRSYKHSLASSHVNNILWVHDLLQYYETRWRVQSHQSVSFDVIVAASGSRNGETYAAHIVPHRWKVGWRGEYHFELRTMIDADLAFQVMCLAIHL